MENLLIHQEMIRFFIAWKGCDVVGATKKSFERGSKMRKVLHSHIAVFYRFDQIMECQFTLSLQTKKIHVGNGVFQCVPETAVLLNGADSPVLILYIFHVVKNQPNVVVKQSHNR